MSGVTEFPDDKSSIGAEVRPSREKEPEEGAGRVPLSELPLIQRPRKFIQDVRGELIRTTWPSRTQVWSTTVVVVIAVIFFGCYLSGCDWIFAKFFSLLEKRFR